MKPSFAAILLAILMLPLCVSAQVCIGIRDSHYANVSYTFKEHFTAKLEHSLYAEKFPCQYLRVYFEYKQNIKAFSVSLAPFYGRTYNSNYWSTGALLNAAYRFKVFEVQGTLNPLYDSTFGYATCFSVGAMACVHGPLSLVAEYTTIPQYRMSEKRIRGGLCFRYDKFSCTPLLSLPVSGNSKFKYIRLDFSLSYQF